VQSRAETRYNRLSDIGGRFDDPRNADNPVKALQERADSLSQRGAELKKVADTQMTTRMPYHAEELSPVG
jgi:hypothetical protein